jgi:SAM-dependent methyltransferase
MEKKEIEVMKVFISVSKELIGSRLPWRIRHSFFVLLEKPLVLKSVDGSLEMNRQTWERSRTRWIHSKPDNELTWGIEVSGDNFVRKVFSYNVFSPHKTILEVGPGKGRLLKSLINLGIPYGRYFGIDISAKNITYLRENFSNTRHSFMVGDIETAKLESFDILLSSLTFKHLFPSFKKALINVSRHMNPSAMLFFDLPEGKLKCFHNGAYIRWYSKSEVRDILRDCNLEIVTLDHVIHVPWHKRRLLVVAKRLKESKTHVFSAR